MKNFILLFSALLLFVFNSAEAQDSGRYDLLLLSGKVTPLANADKFAEQRAAGDEIVHGKYFRIIQFLRVPSEEEKAELKSKGVELISYLPNLAYMASVASAADLSSLNSRNNIRALLPVLPEYKIHPFLKNNSLPEGAEVVPGMADLTLIWFKGIPEEIIVRELQSRLKGIHFMVKDDASQMLRVRVDKDMVPSIATYPFIQYVEPVMPWEEENNSGTTLHRSNAINNNIPGGLSFDGTGVGVSIGDGGAYFAHVDYIGRNKGALSPGATHGTHVAGILGGAGNINPKYAGQAPGVNMIYKDGFDDILSVGVLTGLYNGVDSIRVTNHSLGQGANLGYTADARTADLQVESLPAIYNVHSCGNSGSGWETITGGYKAAKNAIATGNLDYKDLINSSSSRGPSADGRIKPDICAKGTNVQSTLLNNTYGPNTGTSMSSPGAAGCFAQLIEAYRSMNAGADPKLALLKGIVLNTADDLGNAGPDYVYGWGRINVWGAYNAMKDQRYLSSTISQGGNNSHIITVPANTSAIKVMVYWADPAATAGVTKALINDLDIVLAGSSQNYSPWELDFSSPATAATKGTDRDNNMEQVVVAAPPAGTYTLNVNGYLVPQGPQEYWLTYEIISDDIKVTYPIGGESLVPGEVEYVRWDAYGSSGTFTVELSIDSGLTWNVLSASVAATARYYQWTVPTNITGKGLIRVKRGAKSSISQAVFNIIPVPTALKIDWRCPASFQLSWTAVTGATSYEAYLLGTKYMIPQGTTTGTSFWIQSPNTAVTWASVRALAANGTVLGRRAVAIQVPTATSGCLTAMEENTGVPAPYQVSVFPNPMTDHASIIVSISDEDVVDIRLMDICGKEIAAIAQGEKLAAGDHHFSIDNLNVSGMYLVMIKGSKGVTYEKVIVEGE